MADNPNTLEQWRITWTPEEIAWRTGWIAQRDERRLERERAKAERRKHDRQFFGEAVGDAPPEKRQAKTDAERLRALGLPVFDSEADLAAWLGIRLSRLRWYTHDKPVDSTWHYLRYEIPKRSGGKRVILAPKTDLKAFQRKILEEILAKLAVHPAAHGFVPGHSIVTNAAPHAGKAFVLNLDLKDFFPNIGYYRVRGLFIALGYNFAVASALALLCTERDRQPIQRGGQTVYVSVGKRALVQGAPTSPALANLISRRLDARLSGLARSLGLSYTRYADDLTFSGEDYAKIRAARELAQAIIAVEGLTVNERKIHLYRQSNRQVVTGLVVNQRPNTPRELRRIVRAILHHAAQTGLEAQNRDHRPNFRAYLLGLIGYIHEANPEHAGKLLDMLRAVQDEK